MRFLVDAQLPPALAVLAVARGHRAEHVFELSTHSAADSDIWQIAEERGAVVITKDEDFAIRVLTTSTGPAVVWIRVGNTRKADLLRWFDNAFPEIEGALQRGDRLVEVGSRSGSR